MSEVLTAASWVGRTGGRGAPLQANIPFICTSPARTVNVILGLGPGCSDLLPNHPELALFMLSVFTCPRTASGTCRSFPLLYGRACAHRLLSQINDLNDFLPASPSTCGHCFQWGACSLGCGSGEAPGGQRRPGGAIWPLARRGQCNAMDVGGQPGCGSCSGSI